MLIKIQQEQIYISLLIQVSFSELNYLQKEWLQHFQNFLLSCKQLIALVLCSTKRKWKVYQCQVSEGRKGKRKEKQKSIYTLDNVLYKLIFFFNLLVAFFMQLDHFLKLCPIPPHPNSHSKSSMKENNFMARKEAKPRTLKAKTFSAEVKKHFALHPHA